MSGPGGSPGAEESYTVLAEYYDRLTGDVGYEKQADYIERHFRRLGRPVETVLDLACGTGSLAALLARRGYQVTGVDLSPDMLTEAQQKCAGLDVQLVCQDMSRLRLPLPVDAAVCCLDSINYLPRPSAAARTFRRVYRALKPGGLFLFDVKTPLALESAGGQTYLDEDEGLFCVWRGEYDPRRRACSYGLDLFALRPGGLWERMREWHEEFVYLPEELEGWLREAGFRSVRQHGELVMRAPRENEMRVFFSARKEA